MRNHSAEPVGGQGAHTKLLKKSWPRTRFKYAFSWHHPGGNCLTEHTDVHTRLTRPQSRLRETCTRKLACQAASACFFGDMLCQAVSRTSVTPAPKSDNARVRRLSAFLTHHEVTYGTPNQRARFFISSNFGLYTRRSSSTLGPSADSSVRYPMSIQLRAPGLSFSTSSSKPIRSRCSSRR